MGNVVEATAKSVAAADHLDREGKDAGAIAALLAAARKIDDWDRVVDNYFELVEIDPDAAKRPPAMDNSTLGTYLKYCESLGLTPAGRGELTAGRKSGPAPKNELTDFLSEVGIG